MSPPPPDQNTVLTVAEFLTTSDGPFHISKHTARALGELLHWHSGLESDESGDNELVLAVAKAFDDEDISTRIGAIDRHADAKSIPTATITIAAPALDADGAEAEFAKHTPGGAPGPDEPLTQKDLGLHKLALVNQGEQITALTEQLSGIAQQLQQLIIQTSPQCATCATEMRSGTRPGANLVNVILDGTGYCHEHVDLANGRLVPRKSSGIIVAGS